MLTKDRAEHLIADLRQAYEFPYPHVEFYCIADNRKSSHTIGRADLWQCPVVTQWINDGTGHASPLRSTVQAMRANGATFNDIADALERTFVRPIPTDVFDLPKATGRYSKDVHRGGPTPHLGGLIYA